MKFQGTNQKAWLVNDLVISEENCNMNCSYCLTDASDFKESHLNHPIRNPPVKLTYHGEFKEKLDKVTDRTLEKFDIPILKVSGGEVMLIKEIMNFLRKEASRYKVLQILTNGMMLDEKILDEFQLLGNVVLQISIDHHTLEGNGYRLTQQDLQDRLLQKIDLVVQKGIPLELYCVLSDINTHRLDEFLEYLLKYRGKLMVFPFPVRGPMKELFYPKREQHATIERILEHYDHYAGIVPPKPYFQRLLQFLQEGERTFGCALARMVFSTFSDGAITSCPNIWFNHLGNLTDTDYQKVLDKVENIAFYELLVFENTPRLDACKACFTPWDMLGLYIDNLITIDELCETPMYRHPEVRERLIELKEKILNVPLQIKGLSSIVK